MKLILFLLTTLLLTLSCSHHHKDASHHHHECKEDCKIHAYKAMFDKHCAQSVSEGDMHIMGSDEYKITHGGEIYYFSSEKKLEDFKKHIDEKSKEAKNNWADRM